MAVHNLHHDEPAVVPAERTEDVNSEPKIKAAHTGAATPVHGTARVRLLRRYLPVPAEVHVQLAPADPAICGEVQGLGSRTPG